MFLVYISPMLCLFSTWLQLALLKETGTKPTFLMETVININSGEEIVHNLLHIASVPYLTEYSVLYCTVQANPLQMTACYFMTYKNQPIMWQLCEPYMPRVSANVTHQNEEMSKATVDTVPRNGTVKKDSGN